MAVKIRLKRMGAKKKPFYRIVVADSRSPRDGKFIEELGYFDPLKDPALINVNTEKAKKWLTNGAQPTDTVKALFKKAGVYDAARAADEADAADEASAPDAPAETSAADAPDTASVTDETSATDASDTADAPAESGDAAVSDTSDESSESGE